MAEQQKNTSDEFARNRMELSKQLEVMQGKLAEMTKANFEQRIMLNETVTKSLNDIRDRTVQENERLVKVVEAAIGKMQESNEKKLDEMRATVDEKLTSTLTTRLNSSFKTVSEQLENLYKSLGEMKELSAGVTDNVSALNRVLTNVKARGTWAEVQLETILDQTIPNMYEKNIATGEKDSERVEFAIRIPASDDKSRITYLPVDSKFPMEDYVRLCTAADHADPDAVKAARKALEDRVLSEAKMIKNTSTSPIPHRLQLCTLRPKGSMPKLFRPRRAFWKKSKTSATSWWRGPRRLPRCSIPFRWALKPLRLTKKPTKCACFWVPQRRSMKTSA